MSYKKDPIDDFILWLFKAVISVTWAIVAGTISLIIKLLQTPPENELNNRERNTGWGKPGQVLECPRCHTNNDLNSPSCSMCGAQL